MEHLTVSRDFLTRMLLTKDQRFWLKHRKRYNLISCGWQAGSTFMAHQMAIRGKFSASRGGTALFITSDSDRLELDRNSILREHPRMVEKIVGDRIFITDVSRNSEKPLQGSITFRSADRGVLRLSGEFTQIIVDNAHRIPGFYEMWHEQILPFMSNGEATAFVFGRASGSENGFGRLCRKYASSAHGIHACVPTDGNITGINLEEIRNKVSEPEWRQEYLGEVVDERVETTHGMSIIRDGETFLDWCDRLAADGLEVDGLPFRLDNRPTMRWIYDQIPSTIEECFNKRIVIMKCAQVGFTVMEMLATIYLALKFMPAKIGMYLPGKDLAALKSSERFMPIVRTVPDAHKLMLEDPTGTRKTGEGNVLIRNMGSSRFHFLWTSGKVTTESVPLDVVSFDEVQEMAIADMEKTAERLSASRIRYTIMGSTANWPDRDIHFFYKKGTRHQFWTECPNCGTYQVLDDHFPECIRMRDGISVENNVAVQKMDYRYVCHECDGVIDNSQIGEWRPANPDGSYLSIHYPQFLSPTISPREIIEAYFNADDMKNFYNRKLGKPYLDPTQVPVDLEMLNDCARIGMSMGLVWKSKARETFMGIDQMGSFNVVLISERLPSGHMALIHAEEIYSNDPFARCDELMAQFGVSVCVVEQLPNYNDAKRFAGRHPRRVFLASYTEMKDDMMRWGDSVPTGSERRTSEEDRDRFTVTLDQYKCMQVAMKRIANRVCIFPDPDGLVQMVKEKGIEQLMPILKDRVFLHFTRTALIADMDDEVRKFRRRVVKVGIDPHFSYAFMLMNVAWARSHGTTMFLIDPDGDLAAGTLSETVSEQMPGLPSGVLKMLDLSEGTCGRCSSFEDGLCKARHFNVGAGDPGCEMFVEDDIP